jgi:hypothetical protein
MQGFGNPYGGGGGGYGGRGRGGRRGTSIRLDLLSGIPLMLGTDDNRRGGGGYRGRGGGSRGEDRPPAFQENTSSRMRKMVIKFAEEEVGSPPG